VGAVEKSKIEWTDSTWNPTTGCSKVSNGCDHCYAEAMALRLKALGTRRYVHGFDLTIQEDLFELPLRWKKPRNIFVNSMSDLFHEDVPFPILQRIFGTMNEAHWHNFQILTKRSTELVKYADELTWTPNTWIGVTVESDRYLHRLRALQSMPAVVRNVPKKERSRLIEIVEKFKNVGGMREEIEKESKRLEELFP
jgi:protein gp37